MPAYAYPIQIKKRKQVLEFTETVFLEDNILTLEALAFVGEDSFSVTEGETTGYVISVNRHRFETTEERNVRVAREESYMAEYNRRQQARK